MCLIMFCKVKKSITLQNIIKHIRTTTFSASIEGSFFVRNKDETHYENTPMHYTAIFHACKNDNFHLKYFDYVLIFAQNIDCGYTLEPPQ